MKTSRIVVAWVVALALWLPVLSWWMSLGPPESERANGLYATHLARAQAPWAAPSAVNPEWDLMTNMYTVLALSNRALGDDSGREAALAAIDSIVATTLARRAEAGPHVFLLPYSRRAPFRGSDGHSLFVDGEIAMMLAARQLVGADATQRAILLELTESIAAQIESGPALCGESYPDECWTFCNTTALAALRVADVTLGTDHRQLGARWVANARAHLLDRDTGLLPSSYTWDGAVLDGPEGSSLWMSLHNLQLIDPAFAEEQYRRARERLAIEVLGFGFAREWPSGGGIGDVDSGPVIPIIGASPGSSGLALVGAAAFGDKPYFAALNRSLQLAAAPEWHDGELRFHAAGTMGEAVVLYAHALGPLWQRVARAGGRDDA